MDLTLFVILDKLFHFSGLDSLIYKTEAVIVLTSRVVIGSNDFLDV